MRMLQPCRQLNLPAEAADIQPGAELRWQHFDDDIAPERGFVDDEDPRHATAKVSGDGIAFAERALKARSQISQHLA